MSLCKLFGVYPDKFISKSKEGENKLKVYEEPKLEVQAFTVEDVITASTGEIVLPDVEL